MRSGGLPAGLLALAAACGGEGPLPPNVEPPDSSGGTDVQKVALTLTVTAHPEDLPLTQALGWSASGGIPDAAVTVRRLSSGSADTTRTDAAGVARVTGLLEGDYEVTSIRALRPEEIARAGAEAADILAFAGATVFSLMAPAREAQLRSVAGRKGALVLAEFWHGHFLTEARQSYVWNGFAEIYNNADTTIYLDGKLLGSGYARSVDEGDDPCRNYLAYLQDPDGIWSRYVYQFPGSGRDYPIEPGKFRIVAVDAVDHSALVTNGLDLSGADFEIIGRQDVNNPSVPDLRAVGTEVDLPAGHGDFVLLIEGVVYLADNVALDTVPTALIGGAVPREYLRIPAGAILDVFSYQWRGGGPVCRQIVHDRFDRSTLGFTGDNDFLTFQRPVFLKPEDGPTILQRTRTSSRDFLHRPSTVRAFPP